LAGAGGDGFGGIELALLDLDGTVYVGTQPVPGAAQAVARLRSGGVAVRFVSNSDLLTPEALRRRLAGMGIQAAEGEVLTPVMLARELFSSLPGAAVLAVTSPAIRELLADCLAKPGETPTHVLLSDPSWGATYAELDAAFRAIRNGAELVATQTARYAIRDDGEHLDAGSFVVLLEHASGATARVLGKPSREFYQLALEAAGTEPARAVMVGDDLRSDVAGAKAVGLRAVLVRTGKGGGSPLPEGERTTPDAVIDSLASLPDLLGIE
jgi:HAD superfamily hydrolase (TIGR01458 family)